MRSTMPSCSSWRSCCVSIFCDTPGMARSKSETERLAAKQMKEDQELPAAFKHADCVLDADGSGRRRVCTLTHR